LITEPKDYGDGRRVCVRDPNGVYLEIMENEILNPSFTENFFNLYLPVRTQTVTLSVPNLEQAEAFFEGVLGMDRADIVLHTPEMEELWGLSGASTKTRLLWCNDFILELVEYVSPQGKPRPIDYHIGDTGLFHLGLGMEENKYLMEAYSEAIEAGYSSNSVPLNTFGLFTTVYMRTDQDFLVEYLYASKWDRSIGFIPIE
jgi:catechol 2,3-dioxygenase-like lactoylglutathione lyase family enzyme